MNSEDVSQFEVTGHYFVSSRGAIITGQLLSGGIRMGTEIPTGTEPPMLTISGIETLTSIEKKPCGNGLIFREQPTLEFLQRVFPVGTVIQLKQDADDE
jgi:hypothetical protein